MVSTREIIFRILAGLLAAFFLVSFFVFYFPDILHNTKALLTVAGAMPFVLLFGVYAITGKVPPNYKRQIRKS